MANIKNFGIAGVSADVQMGKSGGRVVYDSGNTLFKFTQSNGSTLAKLQVADPTGSTDVVTKGYLDGVTAGLDIKESVRGASTANGTLASAFANGSTMDGLTLATNDRILIKDQTTGSENGIYTVNASGAPTRATDADAATGELDGGSFFFVEAGTLNADSGWVVTNDGTVTIGATALAFTQFSGAGQITAGTGMSKSSNTLNVGAGTGITVNADTVEINTAWTGQAAITTLGTIATGVWNGTAIADANVVDALTISGGTVDGSVIGGSTAAAGSFTTLSASGALTGTLGTAAQTNVTSLGTLTALTVDNLNLNGNALTSTDTNGNIDLTPHGSGEVNITKVDIDSGAIDGTAIGANSASTGAFTTVSTTGTATLAGADINGGSIDGTNIGAASVGTGAFSTISATGAISVDTISEKSSANGVVIDGVTLKDSAVVVDTISEKTATNGVQIDGATIKDNTFLGNVTVEASETLDVSAGTLTLAANQISGDKVEGGTIAAITITNLTGGGTFTGSVNVSGDTLTLAANQISGNAIDGGTISDFASTGIDDNATGSAITIDSSNNVSTTGNLIVGGNLTVSGSSTTVNVATVTVEDPLMLLSSGATGAASVDAGLIIERGDTVNSGWMWDESADAWSAITTTDTATTAGNVTIADYADIHAGGATFDDLLVVSGASTTYNAAAGHAFKLTDNIQYALTIKEAGNAFMYFDTRNGGEKIVFEKALDLGAVAVTGSGFDINGGAIDGAIIGGSSAAAGTFTTLTASSLGGVMDTNNHALTNVNIDSGAIDGAVIGGASAAAGTFTTLVGTTSITGTLTGNADTATALATARTIGGVSFNGSANIVPTTIVVADTTDTSTFVGLWESATGDLLPKTDAGLTYNAGTGTLAATAFSGPLTGAVTGNADTATEATNITAVANNSTNETVYLTFVDGATGTQGLETDTGLSYNPSTGLLSTAAVTTTGEATLASAIVSDLTANRVVLAGTSGAIQDSANFTFDGTTMQITGAANVTGDLDVDNINLNGNVISTSDSNGNLDLTPNGTGSVVIAKADINGGAIDGTAIGAASASTGAFSTISASSQTDLNGDMNFGNATSDTISFVGRVDTDFLPSADGAVDLGSSTQEWRNLYIDGTANIDALVADSVDINGGNIDGTAIGAASASTAVFTDFTSTGITDTASTGTALTIDGSNDITIANDLTVSGNSTVTGNLTVNGTTTTVSTTNTLVEDPLLVLGNGTSGVPANDAGFVVERGDSANVGLIWDESSDHFVFITTTETGSTAGNVSISSNANVKFGSVAEGTWAATAIGAAKGGTGIDSSSSTGVARIDGGTWSVGDASLTADVSGTLPVANGGTGATSLDDIVSADNKLTVGAGADTVVGGNVTLTVNEANLTLANLGGTINLTNKVTGTLPVANGGTGVASGTTGQFLKFTGATTIGAGFAEALYANSVKVFDSSGATTSGAGEGLKLTNASGKAYLRSVNTAASGDVDLYLGAQGSGDVVIEGTGNGIVKGDNDLDLTVRGGDASAADAGDLILSGGNGTGSHDSGNVYIQGGLGGASNGGVQIRDASGNEVLIFGETGSAVNEVTITNAATGGNPTIAASGGDTNVHLSISPKGTGTVLVPAGYAARAGFGTNSLATKEYVDDNSSTETYARRASFTANSSLQNYDIGAVLKTGTTNYVNKVVVSVTTALSGGSIAGIRLHDGTAYLTALDDCDTSEVGTFVIDLPTTTSTASGAQLNVKMVQSNGTTAATPTAGVVVTTVQYVQV